MSFKIDKITWNDLDLESVYNRINRSDSSVGSEYLKKVLQNIELKDDVLIKRNQRINFFFNNISSVPQLKKIFKTLGKTKKVSFLDYIFEINKLEKRSNLKHYILILLLLLAIISLFINAVTGIIAIVVIVVINIISYFKDKSSVEAYFNCCKYLTNMLLASDKILKINLPTEFDEEKKNLLQSKKIFSSVKNNSWLITNSVSGSLFDVILDYVRMLFHIDLIKFNNMQKCITDNLSQVGTLFNSLGEIEICMGLAEFRKDLDYFCVPEFNLSYGITALEMYHPLVSQPVSNSMDVSNSILLTGSNASGKSTFLKTVAINQILAQTIYTCLAKQFHTTFYKVLSSMALTDNIFENESYFIVEIKSLKRIFDELGEIPVMAFIDEVLRGTNTKERIAASSQILKKLSGLNALVFAATHDIELTEILKDNMKNYHFNEIIKENDIFFDYKLKTGKSLSCNAIELLKVYGFDQDIVSEAKKMVDKLDI